MDAICFAPEYNTGTKKDATGAFQPEAKAWAERWDAKIVWVDNHLSLTRQIAFVMGKLNEMLPDRIAFFCHGWPDGIQFGFTKKNVHLIPSALTSPEKDPIVTLFACSTGKGPSAGGDGGFADCLRDALCQAGFTQARVDAHTTAGHTTRNPYVRRFDGLGSLRGGTGGQWIVAPKSSLWLKWKKALSGDFRFEFSDLEIGEIHGVICDL